MLQCNATPAKLPELHRGSWERGGWRGTVDISHRIRVPARWKERMSEYYTCATHRGQLNSMGIFSTYLPAVRSFNSEGREGWGGELKLKYRHCIPKPDVLTAFLLSSRPSSTTTSGAHLAMCSCRRLCTCKWVCACGRWVDNCVLSQWFECIISSWYEFEYIGLNEVLRMCSSSQYRVRAEPLNSKEKSQSRTSGTDTHVHCALQAGEQIFTRKNWMTHYTEITESHETHVHGV